MPNAKPALTVDAYVEALASPAKEHVEAIRKAVREAAPDCTEAISYQIPAFKLNGATLMYAAAWKNHVAVYPVYEGDWDSVPGLAAFKGSKNSAHFPLAEPVPLELIREFVTFKIEQSRKRGA